MILKKQITRKREVLLLNYKEYPQTAPNNGTLRLFTSNDVPVMKGRKWYSLKKELRPFITGTFNLILHVQTDQIPLVSAKSIYTTYTTLHLHSTTF